MQVYKARTDKLPGTSYSEVRQHAMAIFNQIEKRTKRRPYIRSAYFRKQKIFFDFFWEHLAQKNPRERFIRLKYFNAAIDVLKHSRNHPATQENPHVQGELLHRFAGATKENELFYVQVKEDKRSGHKYFMSCFPQK